MEIQDIEIERAYRRGYHQAIEYVLEIFEVKNTLEKTVQILIKNREPIRKWRYQKSLEMDYLPPICPQNDYGRVKISKNGCRNSENRFEEKNNSKSC